MKTVGLIGGTGWPAMRDYYTLLNQLAQQRRGALHGVELRIWSFDFQALLEQAGDAAAMDRAFALAAAGLRQAGAQLLALASVTGHLFAPAAQGAGLPLVHVAACCARTLAAAGVRRAGLLATQRTLAGGVFDAAMSAAGIALVSPPEAIARDVDAAIFAELEHGAPGPMARAALQAALDGWQSAGLTDVLLGCTEIRPQVFDALGLRPALQLWDCTQIHCGAILDAAFLTQEETPDAA